MNRWLLVAIAAAFLFAIAMLVLGPERTEPADAEALSAAEPAWPEDEVPRIEAPVPQTPERAATPVAVNAAEPPSAPVAPPVAPEAEGTEQNIFEPQRSNDIDVYKRAFGNDSTDGEAAATEGTIREILTQVQVPEELVQAVNCHRRVCRLRMLWQRSDSMKMMAALMGLGTHFSPLVQTEPLGPVEDGEVTVDIYAVRPQFTIDDIE